MRVLVWIVCAACIACSLVETVGAAAQVDALATVFCTSLGNLRNMTLPALTSLSSLPLKPPAGLPDAAPDNHRPPLRRTEREASNYSPSDFNLGDFFWV
jgi:hypothetical protein